ncbi:MAG: thiamine phosphate synthase [Candidatus Omnitrophota bacterium]
MRDFKLYVIVDRKTCGERSVIYVVKEAIAGGADVIQLRDKNATAKELIKVGRPIRQLTRKAKVLFIINDRLKIAKAVDADGVHLGQDDSPIKVARSILGRNKIIGLSTHSLSQAKEAQKNGADYIGVGPIFATPTKPEYKAVGLDLIKKVKRVIKIPFVAIGGIDTSNIDEILSAGANRVAVVRAVCGAKNIRRAASFLKRKLQKR